MRHTSIHAASIADRVRSAFAVPVMIALVILGWSLADESLHGQNRPTQHDAKEKSAQPARRLPVPDRAALDATEKAIQQAFGDEIRKATTPAKLVELAIRMRQVGHESKQAVERYALLVHAKGLAIKAGEVELAISLVEALTQGFEVNPLTE